MAAIRGVVAEAALRVDAVSTDRGQGLPLRDEIARTIHGRENTWRGECREQADEVSAVIRPRIEALPRWMMFDGPENLNVVRYEDVVALFGGRDE